MLIVAGYLPPYAGIKRESGENPEQSRCCKLIIRMTTFVATAIFLLKKSVILREGVVMEQSQKTCNLRL